MIDTLRRANRLAAEGARDKAALLLADIVREPTSRDAITSLGFLVSEGLDETVLERCWESFGGWQSLSEFKDAIDAERFPYLTLLVETGLKVDYERARRFIEDVYIPYMKRDEILREAPGRTIFFWHIPKCGGTALNNCLMQVFYRSGADKLPSYTARDFLNLLLRDYTAEFPCLTSSHVLQHRLDLPSADKLYQVLSVRDPVDRAVSAWRQYYASMTKGRSILPQHGAAWNYWPQANLADWAERAPSEVVNRHTATFSQRSDPKEAVAKIRSLDLVFDVSGMDDAVRRMASELGLPLDKDLLKTTRNITDKSISFDRDELEVLRRVLAPDRNFFRRLWWPRWLDWAPTALSPAVSLIYPQPAASECRVFVEIRGAGSPQTAGRTRSQGGLTGV